MREEGEARALHLPGALASSPGRYSRSRCARTSAAAAPCDILISAHPELSSVLTAFDENGKGDRAKLVDSSSCKRYADAAKERFKKRLEAEKS